MALFELFEDVSKRRYHRQLNPRLLTRWVKLSLIFKRCPKHNWLGLEFPVIGWKWSGWNWYWSVGFPLIPQVKCLWVGQWKLIRRGGGWFCFPSKCTYIFNSQRRKGTLLLLFMNGKIYFPSVSGTLRHSPEFFWQNSIYIFPYINDEEILSSVF